MKVWTKNKDYKIQKIDWWWDVFFKDKVIALASSEEAAREIISVEAKEEDFEEESWRDNEFKYPKSVRG